MFNSLGDSKTPLYFLIGSSIGNILLDLLFVAVFQWGVAGVAWATFLAQGAACVLAFFAFRGRLAEVKTEGKAQFFSMEVLKKIALVAVPSILQQSFISIGNIFIQGLVNSYGSDVIAGYSAAIKLNTFIITGLTTLGNGISGFTAQNLGAGLTARIREGYRAGVKMAICVTIPFFIGFFFFGRAMMLLFMENAGGLAMDTGILFLRIVSPFYFVISIKLTADGVLRGTEEMKYFMVATFSDLILRVILAYVFSSWFEAAGIWMSWPAGWCVGTLLSVLFYRIVIKKLAAGSAEREKILG